MLTFKAESNLTNMKFIKKTLIALAITLTATSAFSQEKNSIIQAYLDNNYEKLELSKQDVADWIITDQYYSKSTKITHVYIRQTHNGVELANGQANINIRDNKVFSMGNNLIANIAQKANTSSPSINPKQAIKSAAQQLKIEVKEKLKIIEPISTQHFIFNKAGISLEDIPVKLVYHVNKNNEVRLAWDISINTIDAKHWWSIKVDAANGNIIYKNDWVTNCSFESCDHSNHNNSIANQPEPEVQQPTPFQFMAPPPSTDQYNVYAIPVESPSHGSRSLVVGPADVVASPFGWHDVNGAAGAEYTTTRGNNVYAYDDIGSNDAPGTSPNGGAALDFNFALNLSQAPSGYLDVATTNLFYMSNIMHDVWFQYGFDEASGNFQQTNYSNNGLGNDYVRAEAQDGSGVNNANFSTPADGSRPRMQMYLWTPSSTNLFSVNSPPSHIDLDIFYTNNTSEFGPPVPATPITADLALAVDNGGVDIYDACETITNGASLNGKIVVIRRGDCTFVSKVQAAQDEGALAVIMVNNVSGGTVGMAGTSLTITIPSIMLSQAEGQPLIDSLISGATINGTLVDNNGIQFDTDGDFDNGIIAHEYGHGISTRLTGGASNSNCLGNDEQMGEGWSDWFGLMLTIEPGDLATDPRGIGTFAVGQPVTGIGIRPAPYSTDLGVNNYTYGATNNTGGISMPHGIGFVWSTMLWDLNWAFIDKYGFDPDLYNGTGGNNMVMQLVIDGLKLQPCSPGFVDGRDAILQADALLYNGANECLIWEVFAARGLGLSAQQGSSQSRTDQVEAFDRPAGVTSSQNVAICQGSTYTIGTSTYSTAGTYTDVFTATNGCDSAVTTTLAVTAVDVSVSPAANTITSLNFNSGVTFQWIDCNNNNAFIPNEQGQVYTATANGDYAVIVTENNCSDTSVCTNIIVSGVNEIDNSLSLTISPNPTNNDINVSFVNVDEIMNVVLTDAQGKIVFQTKSPSNNLQIDLSKESKGIYMLSVTNKTTTRVYKVIKQ
jgi:hypothetical protein